MTTQPTREDYEHAARAVGKQIKENEPERIIEIAREVGAYIAPDDQKTINGMVRFAQTVLKERDEERDSLIHMQDIAIEQKDAEIAQLREQLAAYEAQPVVQICQLTPGKWTHLIERPHSTTHLDAIKQEALDQAAAIVERQDVDPAFKLRMASAIRSLKEELPDPQKL